MRNSPLPDTTQWTRGSLQEQINVLGFPNSQGCWEGAHVPLHLLSYNSGLCRKVDAAKPGYHAWIKSSKFTLLCVDIINDLVTICTTASVCPCSIAVPLVLVSPSSVHSLCLHSAVLRYYGGVMALPQPSLYLVCPAHSLL